MCIIMLYHENLMPFIRQTVSQSQTKIRKKLCRFFIFHTIYLIMSILFYILIVCNISPLSIQWTPQRIGVLSTIITQCISFGKYVCINILSDPLYPVLNIVNSDLMYHESKKWLFDLHWNICWTFEKKNSWFERNTCCTKKITFSK